MTNRKIIWIVWLQRMKVTIDKYLVSNPVMGFTIYYIWKLWFILICSLNSIYIYMYIIMLIIINKLKIDDKSYVIILFKKNLIVV